uniref:PSI domain-containing protein n=1 Tax=Hucho hucho TaxID=62062 RepID=A0A4W5KWF4_9TELE
MIHKILKDGFKPFIISETHLSSHSDVIRSMKLDSRKRKLVVGLSEQISILDLQRCQDYNGSCAECVLARDPYCAWTEAGCKPTHPGGVQNIDGGQTNVCLKTAEVKIPEETKNPTSNRTRRDTQPSEPPSSSLNALGASVHSVPLDVPFYLSCPIDSYHAHYSWEHLGTAHPCLRLQASCLHLIPSMQTEHYGQYQCVSKERDYTRVVRVVRATQLLNNHNPTIISRPARPVRPISTNIEDSKNNGATALMAMQAGWFVTFAALDIVLQLLQ